MPDSADRKRRDKDRGRSGVLLSIVIGLFSISPEGVLAQAFLQPTATRNLTLDDIVTTREIVDQQLAPDGHAVAFTVRRARLGTDDYESRLLLLTADSAASAAEVWRAPLIENLRWAPDGTAFTFIGTYAEHPQVLQQLLRAESPHPLLPATLPVVAFEWSPDGASLALLVQAEADTVSRRAWADNGIIYDSSLSVGELLQGLGARAPMRLLRWSRRTELVDTLWTAPGSVHEIVWSPDGSRLAVVYRASTRPADVNNLDIGILTLGTGAFVPAVTWMGWEERPRWSPDGTGLVFQSQGPLTDGRHWVQRNALFISRLDGHDPTPLGSWTSLSEAYPITWASDGRSIFFERGGRSGGSVEVIAANGGPARLVSHTADHLSHCSAAASVGWVSCVRQNLTIPPEIARLDLTSGAIHTLTHLHPEYDTLRLGAGTELRWTNRYGATTNGFLITPPGLVSGHRYPFLVALYGFSRRFSAQAQWITSFPVQALAADGFVVLLMNHPEYGPFRWQGESEVATFWERDNTLASIEAAVDKLVALGVADRARGGIMGWSMGSYWADLAITRTRLFRAASSGEIGARLPSTYWAGNAGQRFLQRALFGGPPNGATYARYLESSPSLATPPQDIPVLREFDSQSVWGLEYAAWLEQGARMEMVFYPDAGHVFERPAQRMGSMRRNRAWFNFWLRDEEDSAQASPAEYARWRAWRALLKASPGSGHPAP
jgi:dipeptidyl aminopeptidase/acylaminoacyl peptidase